MFDVFLQLDCAAVAAGSYDILPFHLYCFSPLFSRSTIRLTGEVLRQVSSAMILAMVNAFPPRSLVGGRIGDCDCGPVDAHGFLCLSTSSRRGSVFFRGRWFSTGRLAKYDVLFPFPASCRASWCQGSSFWRNRIL